MRVPVRLDEANLRQSSRHGIAKPDRPDPQAVAAVVRRRQRERPESLAGQKLSRFCLAFPDTGDSRKGDYRPSRHGWPESGTSYGAEEKIGKVKRAVQGRNLLSLRSEPGMANALPSSFVSPHRFILAPETKVSRPLTDSALAGNGPRIPESTLRPHRYRKPPRPASMAL